MQVTISRDGTAVLDLSEMELVLINNALNEVCNGVHIDDFEFSTRLGGSREEVRGLLGRVSSVLESGGARS